MDPLSPFRPTFGNPPVVEVALSVQFAELPLEVEHFGFWYRDRIDQFPERSREPRRQRIVERFPAHPIRATDTITVTAFPVERMAFRTSDGSEVVQFQPDRFSFHWVRRDGAAYPRFEWILENFEQHWSEFITFSDEEFGERPSADLVEVVYVNRIKTPVGRDPAAYFAEVMRDCDRTGGTGELGPADALLFERIFSYAAHGTRLYASGRCISGADNSLFSLTARARIDTGGSPGAAKAAVASKLTGCRHLINRGFVDLTSKEVRKTVWGQKGETDD